MRRALLFIGSLFFTWLANGQVIRSVKVTELEKIIQTTDRPLVINMWATWCKPCIEEIPYFLKEVEASNALSRKPGDSIRFILVSLDGKENFPDMLKSFVKKRKFNTELLWLDETNADYFCPIIDPKWSGVIPATLFVNHKTGYRNFVEEQVSHDELKKNIMAILQSD